MAGFSLATRMRMSLLEPGRPRFGTAVRPGNSAANRSSRSSVLPAETRFSSVARATSIGPG